MLEGKRVLRQAFKDLERELPQRVARGMRGCATPRPATSAFQWPSEEARGHEREQGKEGRRLHDALDYHEAARSVRQTVSDRTLPSDLI